MGKNRDDQNKGGGFQKPTDKGMPGQPNDRNLKNPKTPMGGGQGQQQKQPFIKKEDSWKDKDK